MSSDLFEPEKTDASPRNGGRRLTNIVRVETRLNHVKYEADARELRIEPGDQVIVDLRHGPVIADVVGVIQRKMVHRDATPRVLRCADESDLRRAESNEQLEDEAYRFALERIRARELKMKLVRTQAMQDRSRLVFYFTADGRIDFRKLVRDLARRFRTRIEMLQIGVRDGAQMLGGIGPCGRELCCSTFLDRFEPVSIRIAKEQGLTLSPDKISGMCGRLMCCLVYEQKVYRRIRSALPRSGQQVRTEFGEAKIRDVDVINRRVDADIIGDDKRVTLPIDEIAALDERDSKGSEKSSDKKLWDGKPPRKKASQPPESD